MTETTTDAIARMQAVMVPVSEHLNGLHADEYDESCIECDRYRLTVELEQLRAELTGGGWRDYSVETYGEAPYDTATVCRSEGGCEWIHPNANGRYLTLGEAFDAARAHVGWHAAEDAEEVGLNG